MIEIKDFDLDLNSNSDQTEDSKITFEKGSVTSMKIFCENGYKITIDI